MDHNHHQHHQRKKIAETIVEDPKEEFASDDEEAENEHDELTGVTISSEKLPQEEEFLEGGKLEDDVFHENNVSNKPNYETENEKEDDGEEKELEELKTILEDKGDSKKEKKKRPKKLELEDTGLLYGINDKPAWYFSALLGLQHYLLVISSSVTYPFLLAPSLCMRNDDPARGYLISTIFFVSGLGTIIQTSCGIRLPIVQGCSITFLVPILATMALPEWRCPSEEQIIAARGPDVNSTGPVTEEEWTEVWQLRMREVQGAIIVASLFEIVLGFTGVIGVLLRWITPLGITPCIALIGLSLFSEAAKLSGGNWGVAFMSILLMTVFSQYFTNITFPVPAYDRKKGFRISKLPVFKLFPILLAIIISWLVCGVLTLTNYFDEKDPARTDLRASIIEQSLWIRIPYPGQWGTPTVTMGAVLGMLSAILASVIESVGDYYACARLSHVPPPPTHAINRGIWMEGMGCLFAGFWGGGCGLTSYSTNISIIAVTKVACRSVVLWTGVFLIFFSAFGKVGAIFATIPDPVIGGVFCVIFSLLTAVGLSSAQNVNMNSSRNLFVLGVSLFFGLMISTWMKDHQDVIQTGNDVLNQTIVILLSTSMFVGGLIGIFLDNTIPGSLEDRGIIGGAHGSTAGDSKDGNHKDCYDIPFLSARLGSTGLAYLPISPTFKNEALLDKITPKFIRQLSRASRRSRSSIA